MRKLISFTVLVLFCGVFNASGQTSAESTDVDLRKSIDDLSTEYINLQNKVISLEKDNAQLKKDISKLQQLFENQKEENYNVSQKLQLGIDKNSSVISANKDSLSARISLAQGDIDSQSATLKKKSLWGIILAFFVLIISSLLTFLFHKKGSNEIEELKQQSDKINQEIIEKFSFEMADMQDIASSIKALSPLGFPNNNQQDLIKALADRITFMEMTLFKMDSSVRGHKHLSKTISQMKDNLLASGYEIVDMLGKPYHDGMKVTANFIEDDTLSEGEQIITGITKPQINYQGKMIQAAQITVSQNI
ncbi:MAG: hypothetical protein KBS72_03730 [Bacteroidales bacterium]|nr:hypothetical protein [Candidatus Cacconaster scatequi]